MRRQRGERRLLFEQRRAELRRRGTVGEREADRRMADQIARAGEELDGDRQSLSSRRDAVGRTFRAGTRPLASARSLSGWRVGFDANCSI